MLSVFGHRGKKKAVFIKRGNRFCTEKGFCGKCVASECSTNVMKRKNKLNVDLGDIAKVQESGHANTVIIFI